MSHTIWEWPVRRAREDGPRLGVVTSASRPDSQSTVPERPDAPQASNQARPATLRSADGDGGTDVRPDQAGPGLPAVPVAGSGKGKPGVVTHLRRPQPAEAVPLRARDVRQGEGQRRHWEQQGHVPGHGQWDFQATIPMGLTAPSKDCCRRVIPAHRHRKLANP